MDVAPMVFALLVNFCIAIYIVRDCANYAPMKRKRMRADMAMLAKRKRGWMNWRYS